MSTVLNTTELTIGTTAIKIASGSPTTKRITLQTLSGTCFVGTNSPALVVNTGTTPPSSNGMVVTTTPVVLEYTGDLWAISAGSVILSIGEEQGSVAVLNVGQVTFSAGNASNVLAANPNRKRVAFYGSSNVFFGPTNNVSTTNGHPLSASPTEPNVLEYTGAIWCYAAGSGNETFNYFEEAYA